MSNRQAPSQPDGFIVGVTTSQKGKSNAEIARSNGWTPGTVLEGDEGFGPTRIVITAIGEDQLLARKLSHNGKDTLSTESLWSLQCRDWKKVE